MYQPARKFFGSLCLLICLLSSTFTNGQIITTIAGNGNGDGGPATAAYIAYHDYLAVDNANNVYISASNRIRKISAAGIITTFAGSGYYEYSGDGGPASAANLANSRGMAFNSAGELIIAENTRIRKISTSGIITTIAGDYHGEFHGENIPATAASLFSLAIAIDNTGVIYFSDQYRIRRISPSGIVNTVAGIGINGYTGDGGPATDARIGSLSGITADNAGNIYFSASNRIRKIDASGIISTVAGTGTAGYSGDNGPATVALLSNPNGIFADATGNIFLSDAGNHVIRKIDNSGVITTIAGTGTAGFNGESGPATAMNLNGPSSLTRDAAGNIYFMDYSNARIRKLAPGGMLTTIAGNLNPIRDGGPAIVADLLSPMDAVLDAHKNVIIADAGNNRVRKIDRSTGIISTIAGNGVYGYSGEGGPATAANMTPSCLITDANDNIYAAAPYRVVKISNAGIITTIAGTGVNGYNGDGIPATAAQIADVTGLAFDIAGHVMITDGGGRIRKVDNTSGIITTIAGGGAETTDNGLALNAQLALPEGLATDRWGNIYFVESLAARVRKVTPAGVISTVAGNGLSGYSGDGGPATAARILIYPGINYRVAVDLNGNLYIVDANNYCIRKVDTRGIITTVAGSGKGGYTPDGVLTPSSKLNKPIGIWADSAGSLYITERFENHLARKITFSPTTSLTMCSGALATMHNDIPLGTWSSGATTIATIDTAGIITGVAPGTAIISYTLPAGIQISTVTVLPSPAQIAGAANVCQYASIQLSNATAGGTWSSSSPSIATISGSGALTSISAVGDITVSYTLSNGCAAKQQVSVRGQRDWEYLGTPGFSDGTAQYAKTASGHDGIVYAAYVDNANGGRVTVKKYVGGTWSIVGAAGFSAGGTNDLSIAVAENNVPYVAYNDFANGVRMTVKKFNGTSWETLETEGISAGQASYSSLAIDHTGVPYISYRDSYFGYRGTVKRFNGTSWESVGMDGFTPARAVSTSLAIDNSNVPYMAFGDETTTRIAVMKFNGTSWDFVGERGFLGVAQNITIAVDHNDILYIAARIANNNNKATIARFDGTNWIALDRNGISDGYAEWPSIVIDKNNIPYVAYIDNDNDQKSMVKKYNGSAWETVGSSYFSPRGMFSFALGVDTADAPYVTFIDITNKVSAMHLSDAAAAITGGSTTCVGGVISLSNATIGGTWTSSNSSVATVSATGTVYANTAGATTIGYTLNGGCFATKTITVTPSSVIASPAGVCIGSIIVLSDVVAGGTWTSSNTLAATVSATGIVHGNNVGVAMVTHTPVIGCLATATITVSPTGAISGIPNTCIGTQTTLHQTETTGIWLMHFGSVALASVVPSTGVVTGIANGVALIDYVTPAGCVSTYSVTVGTLPAITGPSVVTAGSSITLSNPLTGGTWSSGNMSIATADAASGTITGVAYGAAVINYEVATGCSASKTITVNPGIQPNTLLCVGTAITLSDGATGGSWSSGSGAIATVNSSGQVTGVSAGNTIVKHLLPSGLVVSFSVTVNPRAATTGLSVVCQGQNVVLANNTAGGGVWSSANDGIATVSPTGVVTGAGAGNTAIHFTTPAGCIASKTVMVNPAPAISGPASVCVGQTINLSSSATGIWNTSSAALAAVSTAGQVKGMAAGNVRISYMLPTGCFNTRSVTVNPLAATTGVAMVCQGMQIILANTTVGGGTWSGVNTSIAIAAGSGVITGTGAGNTAILFTTPAGCIATKTITVNATPQLSGAAGVCAGQSVQLSSNMGSGIWTSSTAGYATVSSTGLVRGIVAGTVRISYGIAGGCQGTTTLSVRPLSATTGAAAICSGQQLLLGNSTPGGGVWSSSSSSIAAVSSTGLVTGNNGGMAVIFFTTPVGCIASKTVTVNAAALITAPPDVCAGQTAMVSSNTPGGTWSSSNNALATVSAARVVTGVAAGTVRISYNTAGAACPAVATLTVYPLLSIAGSPGGCVNRPMTLTNGTPGGGIWTSSNTAIATVSNGGVVSGNSTGTVVISFTSLQGCSTSKTITIGALPVINGIPVMCVGQTTTMSGSPAGGNWYTSADALARAAVTTGVITGVSAGSPGITYVLPTGCWAAQSLTVKPLNITTGGTPAMCQSGSMTVINTTVGGGTWSTANTNIATVSATGVVRGVAPGVTNILFTTPLGCTYTRPLTINACRESGEATSVSAVTKDDIKLYPNPNNGQFTLSGSLNGTDGEVSIEVVNMLGQVIYRGNAQVSNGSIGKHIELPGTLASGTYMLNLITDGTNKLFRFVIE